MIGPHASGLDVDVPSSLMAPVALVPDENQTFRLARTLLLLTVALNAGKKVTSLDRIGYYDFFADSPFMIVDGDSERDSADRLDLELAGFVPNRLDYASSGPRFVSRRRRLQHDLALLIGHGLAEITSTGYEATEAGVTAANQMSSAYADAFRASAAMVLRRLANMSGAELERTVDQKLGESWLLVDLLADVNETTIPEEPSSEPGDRPLPEGPTTDE